MKNTFICLLLGSILFTSCKKNDINPEIDFDIALDLPSDTEWQRKVKTFYEDYNTYVRTDYTTKDVIWSWDSYKNYNFTLPKTEESADQLFTFVESTLFDVYPDELLEKMLPYQILLADTLRATKSTTTQSYALSGMNYIIFGGAGANTFPNTAAKKLAAAKEIHECFALSLITKVQEQPNAFWSVSTYERMNLATEAIMYEQGYVFRNRILPPDQEKDYASYVAWIASSTPAQIKAITDTYPLVRRKVELLKEYYAEQLNTNLNDLMQK